MAQKTALIPAVVKLLVEITATCPEDKWLTNYIWSGIDPGSIQEVVSCTPRGSDFASTISNCAMTCHKPESLLYIAVYC